MKNSLVDLNNHLFAQMERLSEEDLKGEKLQEEIARTKSITSVANSIIQNARLVLEAQIELGGKNKAAIPGLLGVDGGDK